METVTITDEAKLQDVARTILGALVSNDTASVVTLQGDLGAGKTALTKAFARELGIKERITSPTFVVMKIYGVPRHPWIRTLTHIDAYRIEDEDELRVLGFETLLQDPTRLVVIEWPERIKNVIPCDAYPVSIALGEHGERTITYGS